MQLAFACPVPANNSAVAHMMQILHLDFGILLLKPTLYTWSHVFSLID